MDIKTVLIKCELQDEYSNSSDIFHHETSQHSNELVNPVKNEVNSDIEELTQNYQNEESHRNTTRIACKIESEYSSYSSKTDSGCSKMYVEDIFNEDNKVDISKLKQLLNQDETSLDNIKQETIDNNVDSETSNCTPPEDDDWEENIFSYTSPDMTEARFDPTNVLPDKSKKKYEKQYQIYMEWCHKNKVKKCSEYSEDILLMYFSEIATTRKSSTLWSIYSMLRSTFSAKHDINIQQYKNLISFLKKQGFGYEPKKSKTFTNEEIIRFLNEAPDDQFLMKKVILIFGVAGACRRDELVKMVLNNIEDKESLLIVKIPDTKTKKIRVFTITNDEVDLISPYRKYISLRPQNCQTPRLFIKYIDGRCTNQCVGMNTIGKTPSNIAKYLGLPDYNLYSGHSFRCTATSLLNRGVGLLQLKLHGGWRGSNIAKVCVENSITENVNQTPPDIAEATNSVTLNLLPDKSKKKYEQQYELFMQWCIRKQVKEYSEDIFLIYFSEMAKTRKSSTMWSMYSMLRATLLANLDIDIHQYKNLIEFLKKRSSGYKSEKSKTFTNEEIIRFLKEAPDDQFLMKKVLLIFGVAGSCRRDELVKMVVNDVEDKGSLLLVKIPDTKTKNTRIFTITNDEVDLIALYRKYISLRPQNCSTFRLFIKYINGRCTSQCVGMNTVGKTPSNIAKYLGLPDYNLYNGHSFRCTSLLLNS